MLPTALVLPLTRLALLVQEPAAPATTPAAGGEGTPPGGSGGGFSSFLLPMVLIFGIFYFLVILPERKKQRAREAMLKALKKGDRVVTSGGIHGSVVQVADDVVHVQVADGVRLKLNRSAVLTIEGEPAAESKPS